MRNTPLKGLIKNSPVKGWDDLVGGAADAGSYALSKGKSLVSKVASKGLGVVGMMLDATPTSSTDQPGTGTHGGKKIGSIRDMK